MTATIFVTRPASSVREKLDVERGNHDWPFLKNDSGKKLASNVKLTEAQKQVI